MGRGIVSDAKSVGAGVLEYRIDSGPGYRIYFGRDGESLIVLLGGGTKRRQQADIERARRPALARMSSTALARLPTQAPGGLRRWH